MKTFFYIRLLSLLVAFLGVGSAMAQPFVNISFPNASLSSDGLSFTFDVAATAVAGYTGNTADWNAINIRFDMNLGTTTIVSGTNVLNPANVTGANYTTSVSGGTTGQKFALVYTKASTPPPDFVIGSPVTLGTVTLVFSAPVSSNTVSLMPRSAVSSAGSSYTTNPGGATKNGLGLNDQVLLPINFSSFTGIANGCSANLAWATSTEQNSSYFGVEYATDGNTFIQVGTVASKNRPTGAKYSYVFNRLASGTGYFRLKGVDFDGRFSYSPTVAVTGTGDCAARSLSVSPNPVTSVINVNGLAAGDQVALLDGNGKQLAELTATGTSQRINVSMYAKGVYILSVKSSSGNSSNVKVVKQ